MMNNDILNQFNIQNHVLVDFNLRIEFSENEIWVWHPFLFDNRLIPFEFLGMKVNNVILSETLPEIFSPQTDIPLWTVENPSNYISFVENNLHEIREALRLPEISKWDALNALTGNFKQHVEYWYGLMERDFD